jgi:BON domain
MLKRLKRTFARVRFGAAVALGAAAMYVFDPQLGHGRRARIRDQVLARIRRAERRAQQQRRYAAGVAEGQRFEGKPMHAPADDRALADRIRSQLGPRFPHARVTLNVVDSVADLRGELDDVVQMEHLVQLVREVPGVVDVISFLHLPGRPAPNKEAAERASYASGSLVPTGRDRAREE